VRRPVREQRRLLLPGLRTALWVRRRVCCAERLLLWHAVLRRERRTDLFRARHRDTAAKRSLRRRPRRLLRRVWWRVSGDALSARGGSAADGAPDGAISGRAAIHARPRTWAGRALRGHALRRRPWIRARAG